MRAYTFTRATASEQEPVLAILIAAAKWLQSKGINQWEHYLQGDGEQDLAAAIGRGEVYLVTRDGRPVATISLQPKPSDWDRAVWGEVDEAEATYVHRLAIDREFAGTGLGEAMLDWVADQARAEGKRYLRLDCVGENERLNAYYAKRYSFKGRTPHYGRTFSKYEQELETSF